MRCIRSHNNNPFFNLAAEEYLLKNFSEDFYFQYVNQPAVIIGKHQNAFAEMDNDFLQQEGIVLARRISGGGAVYHDRGNVNYSFITNETPGDFIKFKKYTAPIIDVLKKLGVDAYAGSRNEILLGKGKISGTASHIYKSRVIHHGTLLYRSDLEKLAKCLYVNNKKFRDKAVKSVRSEVVNIADFIPKEIVAEEFYDFLFKSILHSNGKYVFSEEDLGAINELVLEKFSTWEWNYGYSPKYVVEREIVFDSSLIHVKTTVIKGIINSIEIVGSLGFDTEVAKEAIIGLKYEKSEVEEQLKKMELESDVLKLVLSALF